MGPGPEDAFPEPVQVPITGELDLHTYSPKELVPLLDAYLEACLEKGITTLRIIHGKGTGALRERVHGYLRRSPWVIGFRLGDEHSGSWGATLVTLVKKR